MGAWLSAKREASAEWLAFAVHDDRVEIALVQHAGTGRPAVRRCEVHTHRGAQADTLKRLRGTLHARRYRCTTLLSPGQYQLQLVEAPSVPQTELKQAVRWKLKDLLHYPGDGG